MDRDRTLPHWRKYGFPISQISIARSVPGLRLYPRRLCACNMKGSSEIIFSTCMPPVVKRSFLRLAGLFEPQHMHASTVYTQCHCSSHALAVIVRWVGSWLLITPTVRNARDFSYARTTDILKAVRIGRYNNQFRSNTAAKRPAAHPTTSRLSTRLDWIRERYYRHSLCPIAPGPTRPPPIKA